MAGCVPGASSCARASIISCRAASSHLAYANALEGRLRAVPTSSPPTTGGVVRCMAQRMRWLLRNAFRETLRRPMMDCKMGSPRITTGGARDAARRGGNDRTLKTRPGRVRHIKDRVFIRQCRAHERPRQEKFFCDYKRHLILTHREPVAHGPVPRGPAGQCGRCVPQPLGRRTGGGCAARSSGRDVRTLTSRVRAVVDIRA